MAAPAEYLIKAFPNNAQPEDIQTALNALALEGWRVHAAGAFFNSHIVYLARNPTPTEPEAPVVATA